MPHTAVNWLWLLLHWGFPVVVIVAGIVLVAYGVKEFVDAGKDMDDDEE